MSTLNQSQMSLQSMINHTIDITLKLFSKIVLLSNKSNNRYQRGEISSATSVCAATSIHHCVVLSEHPGASVITDIRMKEVKSRAEQPLTGGSTRVLGVVWQDLGGARKDQQFMQKKKDKGNCIQAVDGVLAVVGASNGWISLCSFES